MESTIDIQGVEKIYRGKTHALRGVDLRIAPGEVFGLLGPNGAGKSTLVKILMTVIRPTKCAGTMLGQPIGSKSTLARVGYLPEHHKFPGYLKGAQVLDFFGAMSGVPRAQRKRKAAELLELVDMSAWANTRIGKYSKGMRQRVGLAQALMNNPQLVVLDEPTDGVDPVGRRDIRNILLRLKDEGRTVFLNSHLLSELEMVCDRVAIMVKGKVTRQGTIDELTEDTRRYIITLHQPSDLAESGRLVGQALSIEGVQTEDTTGSITIPLSDPAKIQGAIDRLRAGGQTIRSIQPSRASLEDLFMSAVAAEGDATPGASKPHKGGER
ncbi:MAG: ABC transporter ATP-binding protein [Phycisphaerales bacterium]|nr:ABC transporter ATP-binding protein [Phycisphaerales bacterium]